MTEHIVFIPGVGGREWLFEHQIKNLADVGTSEVLVLDSQVTRMEMAEHVLAVAPQSFSIAGHSLGGWVAQEVAARAPERVSKLFLCDTRARKPEGTDEYLRNSGPTPSAIWMAGAAADYSTEDLLPRITADTLVIHGRQDRVVVEEEVEFLADGIAGAALPLIEEAGHCSPIEQPQAFTAVMGLWLTR